MPNKIILETDRLILREITLELINDMFLLHSDVEVQRFTGEAIITSKKEMEEAILSRVANYSNYGYGRWACFLKDGNEFIGWAGLAYLPEFDEIDLGYRFFPKYWGFGYATEVSKAILKYGFKALGIKKIIAIAMKENKASVRVIEKAGMHFLKLAPYEEGGEDVVWYEAINNSMN